VAVARLATRHFGKPWGFAVFGQMDSTAADALFPLTYDAGATYFWFWTSDDGHHVPWSRQLELARKLQAYAAAHPRGDPAKVSQQATAAVALPWGYALDDWTLSRSAHVWDIPSLPLDAENAKGTAYRDVLAAAMRAVVGLLQRGVSFDVLFSRRMGHGPGRARERAAQSSLRAWNALRRNAELGESARITEGGSR
jgi:hypothetical protein